MTANFSFPQQAFIPQQPIQQVQQQAQFIPQPTQAVPVQAQTPVAFAPPQAPKVNIWYSACSQKDYKKLSEMGTATIIIRLLPGFNQNGCYEAIFEKNTANSRFPNSKRWLTPVLVLSDSLHPERNGFVGVMELSKTLYNRIKNKNTPANYFDFNVGHNFHINVSLQQSKDGNQWFPNYAKSVFDANPTPAPAAYVCQKMQELKFSDFATFINRLNNPRPAQAQPVQQMAGGFNAAPAYAPAAPVQAFVPPTQQQFIPQQTPQQVPQQQFIPPTPAAPQAPVGSEAEFNEIFGQG